MPRRTTHRPSPAESDAEMVDATPVVNDEMDEEEEEVPVKRSRSVVNASRSATKSGKVKKEKANKSRARRDASGDEGDAEEDPEEFEFDRDAFLKQIHPIPDAEAKQGGKLPGIISDFQVVIDQLQNNGFTLVTETAVAVEEVSAGTDAGKKAAQKLDDAMRELLDAKKELEAHQQSLDSIKQSILQSEPLGDLEEAYKSKTATAVATYQAQTTRQKYAKNASYKKFKENVWETSHDDAMPPLGNFFPKEDGDSDSESDIEVGGMTQTYKCPLTLTHLANPMTSKLCNHSFSGDAIKEYLSKGKGRKQCPATGCPQILSIADLEYDKDLEKRAANALRRAKRREEESDEDEAEMVDDD
ncbi:hypothetical protein M422DRAFT_240792 [Sphaerobolus stellatus SS14]|nr:hypothetical protein M422DRAFT_240792 [Sphaerobolus stellatus SS14]